LAVVFALAGCGRKGGLDAPPGASLANPPSPAQVSPEMTPDGQPVQLVQPAPPPPKRTLLDWLID